MSCKIIHPKPVYELKDYSSPDSEHPVRFCYFRYEQDMLTLSIILDKLKSMERHPKNKLKATVAQRSLHFTIEEYGSSDVHLVISKLAYQIIPSQTRIMVKNDYTVIIMLTKVKPQVWKSVIYVSILVKNYWIKSMKNFLYIYFQGKCQVDELDDIWGRVEGLFTDDINFYLNPPRPFGPLKVLGTAKNIDNVIKRVKDFTISRRGDKKVDATMPYFLGAAILFELQESFPAIESVEKCDVSLETVTLRGDCIIEPLVSLNLKEKLIYKDEIKKDNESNKSILNSSKKHDSKNLKCLPVHEYSNSKTSSEKALPKLSDICPKSQNNFEPNLGSKNTNKFSYLKRNSLHSNQRDNREYLLNVSNLKNFRKGGLHNRNCKPNRQIHFQRSNWDSSQPNYNVLKDRGSFFNSQLLRGNYKNNLINRNKKSVMEDIHLKDNETIYTDKNNENDKELFSNSQKQKNCGSTILGSCALKENLPQHSSEENYLKKKILVSKDQTSSYNANGKNKVFWEKAEEMKSQGNKFYKDCNYRNARDCYTGAIDCNQDNPIYYTNRAACFLKLEQYQECWDDAYKANNLDPCSSKAYYYMGKSALHTGWIFMGVSYLSMAARLNPICVDDVLEELQIGHWLKENVMKYITSMQDGNYKKSQEILNDIDKFCKIGVNELRDRMYTDFLQGGESMNIKYLATADLTFNERDVRAIYYLAKSNFHLDLKVEALSALMQCNAKYAANDSFLIRIMELKKDIDSFYDFKEKGDSAFAMKDYNEAQKWYLLCVGVDSLNKSENAKLYCKLGDMKMTGADYEEAIRYFTLSRNQNNVLLEPRMKKIECHEKMGQYLEATEEAIEISELTCSEEEHFNFLDRFDYEIKKCEFETNADIKEGEKHQSKKNYALAIDCYTKALLSDIDCAPLFVKRSQCYLEIEKYRLAFLDAAKAGKFEPTNVDVCIQMGKCCLAIGLISRAQSMLKLANEIDSSRIEVLTELRKVRRLDCLITLSTEEIENKNFEVAASLLKDAISIARGYYDLQLRRAECLILIDNCDEIESIIKSLMPGIDERPEYETLLGMQCYYQGNFEESIEHFKKALEIDPENLKALQLLSNSEHFLKIKTKGDFAFSKHNLVTALILYRSGFKVDPQNNFINSLLNFKVGLVLIEKKSVQSAIEAFSSAISLRSRFLDAYLKRAECNLLLGKKDLVVGDYRTVCKLFPNDRHDKLLQSALNLNDDQSENC